MNFTLSGAEDFCISISVFERWLIHGKNTVLRVLWGRSRQKPFFPAPLHATHPALAGTSCPLATLGSLGPLGSICLLLLEFP